MTQTINTDINIVDNLLREDVLLREEDVGTADLTNIYSVQIALYSVIQIPELQD